MNILSNLAWVVLISQGLASTLLVVASLFDAKTFEKINSKSHVAIPGVLKIIRLFRTTEKPLMMALYFLSLVFVMFSYVAFTMLVVYAVILFSA